MIWDWLIGLLFGLMMFIILLVSIVYMIKDSLEMKKFEEENKQ